MKSEKQVEGEIKNSIRVHVKKTLDNTGYDHTKNIPLYMQDFDIIIEIPALNEYRSVGAWNEGEIKNSIKTNIRYAEPKPSPSDSAEQGRGFVIKKAEPFTEEVFNKILKGKDEDSNEKTNG